MEASTTSTTAVEEHEARVSTANATDQAQQDAFFSPRSSRIQYSDRFIPCRNSAAKLNFSIAEREPGPWDASQASEREDSTQAYNMLLRSELLGIPPAKASPERGQNGSISPITSCQCSPVRKMLRFKTGDKHSPTAGGGVESPYSLSPIGQDSPLGLISPKLAHRKIARSPFKVLDAPSLQDDFYLNLVDWSSQNVLAVGLGSCVYLWSASSSKVTKLCDLCPNGDQGSQDSVCSVGWSQRGTFLSVGTNTGQVQIWDVAKVHMVRRMEGHRARVGTMAWNSHLLSSGSRDRTILQRDIRAPEDFNHKLAGHRSEVCGLKWSPDDRELASGGNDNQLFIWGGNNTSPVIRFSDHQAAVKAIAWSPHQHGLVASGGGTADRCIRFWNTATGSPLNCIDTGSQVCNLAWSKNVNEIVSTHGYSQNQIVVWKYPSMSKLTTLVGHSTRVLYLATSPDGQTVVTGAGDETLRFWNIFPGPKSQTSSHDTSVGSMMRTQIR